MSATATFVAGGAAAGLLVAPIALAAVRVRSAVRRAEAVWFLLFLGAVLAVAVTGTGAAGGPAGLLAAAALTWATGAHLAASRSAAPAARWHAVPIAAMIAIAACTGAGWWGSLLWLLPVTCAAALAAGPVYRLWVGRRHDRGSSGRVAPGRWVCGLGLLAVAGALVDQIVQGLGYAPLRLAVPSGGLAALGSLWCLAELDYLRAPAGAPDRGQRTDEQDALLPYRLAIAGYLTAGVAHEFKNILANIETTAAWGASGGDAVRALRLIRSHAGSGAAGVNEMLTTTLGDGPEAPAPVSVLGEVNKILGVVASTLHAARVTIRLQVPAELAVVTRKRELLLALLNLIQNAGQATAARNAEGGAVTVAGRRDGERCILEVSDAAGGVDPAVADRLFERGAGTGSGSGLGLFLARGLVDRNGGDLTYHAIPGGSCFRIVLPVEPAAWTGRRVAHGG